MTDVRFQNGEPFELRLDRYSRDAAGLTKAQRRCLVVIAELRVELGWCPSFREVAGRYGIHLGGYLKELVDGLAAKGYVTRRSLGRTLQPTDLGWKISGVDSNGLTDPRVDGGFRCPTCAAVTFKPHKPETCRQLLTGLRPFEQQEGNAVE